MASQVYGQQSTEALISRGEIINGTIPSGGKVTETVKRNTRPAAAAETASELKGWKEL